MNVRQEPTSRWVERHAECTGAHVMLKRIVSLALVVLAAEIYSDRLQADERLCDSSTENCRTPLLRLISEETQGIDVGFWFMEDSRYTTALIDAHERGVRIRVLIDTKANTSYPANAASIAALRDARIPMRRITSSWLHWKMMVFAGQNVVEFGSANFSPHAFVPSEPLVDFIDETIFFSDDPSVVNSFKTTFDNAWTSTSRFANYANISGTPTRAYPVFTIDPELNFPPAQNFGSRAVSRYHEEDADGGIDVVMYRITDRRHTDALIAAHQRGVPVRVLIEQREYRLASRYLHSWNVDRLYAAGVAIRQRRHAGWNHEKLMLLRGQRMTIFGSQNWSDTPGQYEHNYFTRKAWMYDWFVDRFERKWSSNTETEPFTPLPPDAPSYRSPSSGTEVDGSSVTLRWHAGFWAHRYDIYFGMSPNPPLLAANVELGNSTSSGDLVSYTVGNLQDDAVYYWRVVSKTMANVSRSGPLWNLRTGAATQPAAGDVVLWATRAALHGNWQRVDDATAAGGSRVGTTDGGVRISPAQASPSSYFDMSFSASAGVPYRIWIRGKASGNRWANDSVFVQFSDSVTSGGSPTWRIGSTSAATVTIEDCTSCGLSSWGWNDNLTNNTAGALGTPVYFATTGTHTVRIQVREDGLSIDQIVLSRDAFLTRSPGTTRNDGTILPEAGGSTDSPPPPPPLPAGWQARDIGTPGMAGSASYADGVFTVRGAGADVWGTSDAFHFAYRSLEGDGSITARVASIAGTQEWTKVGVMIRASTSPGAAHAFMLVSTGKGLALQRRRANGGSSVHTSGGSGTAPRWVRLVRVGSRISAYVSNDGSAWSLVASDTISLPATALAGLAVSSHTSSAIATAAFEQVSVTSVGADTTELPAGWDHDDIGSTGAQGSAAFSEGVFTVRGSGEDVWDRADAFHFVHRSLAGDGAITARVRSMNGSEAWTKTGVMIRASTADDAPHAFVIVSQGKGVAFQRRPSAGALSVHTSGGAGTAPEWVRLVRAGSTITAYRSEDGSEWTLIGSDTISLPSTALVGLAVSSHDRGALATATFESVALSNGT